LSFVDYEKEFESVTDSRPYSSSIQMVIDSQSEFKFKLLLIIQVQMNLKSMKMNLNTQPQSNNNYSKQAAGVAGKKKSNGTRQRQV